MKPAVPITSAFLVARRGILLALVLLLAACSKSGTNPSSEPVVEAKVAAVLEALKTGNYDVALDQYAEGFFKAHSREEWRDKLKSLMAERGPMGEWHLRRSQADSRFSGKFYLYEYESVHDGNKRLHHLFTLLWPVDGDEIRLLGHKITPWEAEVAEQGVE